MANRILTAAGYEERVRGVMGLTAAYLPNDVINQPEHLTLAEAEIIKLIPDYTSKTGDDKTKLESVTVFEVARRICPTMPARLPKTQQGPHAKTDLQSIDWNKRSADLLTDRNTIVEELNPITSGTFFGFDVSAATSLNQ